MICKMCNTENTDGTRFCQSCGQPLYEADNTNYSDAVQNNQPYYPPTPQYQQSSQNNRPTESYPMSVGSWIGVFFLSLIPIANIILLFVWAFGGTSKVSLKTYARAQLILSLIAVLIVAIIAIIIVAVGASASSYYYY